MPSKKEEIKEETIVATVTNEETRTVERAAVDKAIRTSVYASMGLGVFPSPLFNVLTVTASNLNLARKLSKLYGVEFKEDAAKKIISSIAGAGTGTLAAPFLKSLVACIPLIGAPLYIGTAPMLNGMTTYALGRMFATHFERGGNFVGTNMDAMKEDFKESFKNSREWLGDTIKGKEKPVEAVEAAGV